MADKVTIELEVLAKRALDSVDSFAKKAQGQLDSITFAGTVTAINQGMELVSKVAGPVFDLLEQGFNKAAAEALEAEASAIALANALRVSGEFSQDAVDGFNELASAIQKSTTITDDAVISAVSLAKSYGLSNVEAKNAIKVATDLSARLGIDLGSATEKVAKTMTGFVDRDLGRMIGGLKSLTKEQLIAGEGLALIQTRVEGSAEALTKSFGGALKQLKNNFNEVFEQFGAAVISTPEFSRAINSLAGQFGILAVEVARLAPDIARITGELIAFGAEVLIITLKIEKFTFQLFAAIRAGFNATVQAVGGLIEAIPAFFDFLIFSTERGAKKFQEIFSRLNPVNFFTAAKTASDAAGKTFDPLIQSSERIRDAISGADKAMESFNKTLEKDTGKAAAKRLQESLGDKEGAIKQQLVNIRSTIDDIVQKSVDDVTKAPLSGLIRFAFKGQEELDKVKRKIDAAVSEIINNKDIPEAYKQQARSAAEGAKSAVSGNAGFNMGVGFASAIISGVRKGAAGAAEAVAGVAGGVASAFFGPVIGQLVQQITEFLAQGPEAVKKQIREFELAVPDVVQNIFEAIPAAIQQIVEDVPLVIKKIVEMIPRVIDAFIKSVPEIVTAFIDSIPEIMNTLAEALPRLMTKFASLWPQIAVQFLGALIKGLPKIFKLMTDQFLKIPALIIEGLVEGIKEAIGGLGDAFGGVLGTNGGGGGIIGGVGDFFGGVGDFLGFAEGGRIPDLPQFAGDRFPARLSAGEQVFSKDLSSKLDAFLAGSQGGTPTVVQINIGQRELARVLLDLNRNGFRTA